MNTNNNFPKYQYCYVYSSDNDANFSMANPPVDEYTICPRYANNACFVSNFSDPDAGYSAGLYKGCSPFEFETEKPQCNFHGDGYGHVPKCKKNF